MEVCLETSHRLNRHGRNHTPVFTVCRGLTLLELMVTITVLSITVSAGVPTLAGLVTSSRVSNEINQLNGSLRYALSEAITRNQVVVACPSPDGKRCVRSQDWEQGWLIFIDTNNDRALDPDDTVKRVFSAMPAGITATYRAFGPTGQYIPFYPIDGMRTNGTFSFCVEGNPDLNRALIVAKTRPWVSKTLRNGDPIKCPG